jgi:carbamoyltransferase
MGAAAYIYFSILNNKREKKFNNPYLGPSYSNQEVKSFLEENNIEYYEFKNDKEKVEKTAHLIYQNKVVAWFQGAMEWGPRALGARSILAHPGDPEMKNKLNKKVKHRESFRPFAPAICQENVYEYFDCECPLPDISRYMLGAYPILDSKQKEIPSACHVNGTGRAQVVNSEDTPLYYEVIREFGKISGIPIIINTSFNVRGEPIVCTPEDAYNCFANTGIDHLVIEDFLINKDK